MSSTPLLSSGSGRTAAAGRVHRSYGCLTGLAALPRRRMAGGSVQHQDGARSLLRSRRQQTLVASGNGSVLPWQAAMDEVKKRKDLKSIMIIGAGPIVIGQVRCC
jgi:hypothetical protein